MWSIFWFFNGHWAFFLALEQGNQAFLRGDPYSLPALLSAACLTCSIALGLRAECEGV